jgi:hypothetical protein
MRRRKYKIYMTHLFSKDSIGRPASKLANISCVSITNSFYPDSINTSAGRPWRMEKNIDLVASLVNNVQKALKNTLPIENIIITRNSIKPGIKHTLLLEFEP